VNDPNHRIGFSAETQPDPACTSVAPRNGRSLVAALVAVAALLLPSRASAEIISVPILVTGYLWTPWCLPLALALMWTAVRRLTGRSWAWSFLPALGLLLVGLVGGGLATMMLGAGIRPTPVGLIANVLLSILLYSAVEAVPLRFILKVRLTARAVATLILANLIPLAGATLALRAYDAELLAKLRAVM
jgi:drug/metabolite transporter (DMT)-like permease